MKNPADAMPLPLGQPQSHWVTQIRVRLVHMDATPMPCSAYSLAVFEAIKATMSVREFERTLFYQESYQELVHVPPSGDKTSYEP